MQKRAGQGLEGYRFGPRPLRADFLFPEYPRGRGSGRALAGAICLLEKQPEAGISRPTPPSMGTASGLKFPMHPSRFNMMDIPEGMVVRTPFRKIDGPFYIVISKMLREGIESNI